MKRGDIVTVSVAGDYGKPRPAVVVQSDRLADTQSVLVCLITSELREAPLYRLALEPNATNNLKIISQAMVDKVIALPRRKCGKLIGRLDDVKVIELNHMLSLIFGLAD